MRKSEKDSLSVSLGGTCKIIQADVLLGHLFPKKVKQEADTSARNLIRRTGRYVAYAALKGIQTSGKVARLKKCGAVDRYRILTIKRCI